MYMIVVAIPWTIIKHNHFEFTLFNNNYLKMLSSHQKPVVKRLVIQVDDIG